MSEYPSGWIQRKLGEFCQCITKGTTPGQYTQKGVNFVKVESVSPEGKLIESKFAKVTYQEHEKLKRSQLHEGDILLSIAGTLGRVASIGKEYLPANTNQALAIVRLKSGALDLQYCLHFLASKEVQSYLQSLQTIGAQPNLSLQQVSEIPLALPPLPEQKKIAEILSGIDSLAQRIKTKVEKLEHAKNALIQNLYQDGAERWSALGKITDFVTSGSRGWSQYYSSKGAKFVRIGNLRRSSIDLDPTPEKWQLVDPPEGAEGARTKLEESDLLISITADLGICCIYSGSIGEAYINQHIALVRLAPNYGAYARQIAYYICSEHCQEQIHSMNDSGAKAGLNLDSIRKIRVPLMQDGGNNKIVQNIDALQSAISTNLVRLRHLTYEKNALLSDLLSGRKRVSV